MSRHPWGRLLVVVGVCAMSLDTFAADPVKVGGEIVVHDSVDGGYAYTPRVASDPAGNFVVAWHDTYNAKAKARAFWSTGNARGPVLVLSAPGVEVNPGSFTVDEALSIAADAAGNFVVAYNAYNSYYEYSGQEPACEERECILTRRILADGSLAAAEFVVGDPRLFGYTNDYNQTGNPELAADGEGNFVVAWEGYDLSPSGFVDSEGVWARRLVGSGQVNGSQFRVNELTDEYQGDEGQLDVAADEEGNFVLVWTDYNDLAAPPYGGIVFRRFDKAKNPVGTQTPVASYTASDPHVAQTPGGQFMVVWEEGGIQGQVFDENGVATGPAFEVTADGYSPEIAASGADTFVVVYGTSTYPAGKTFDILGTATSSEFSTDSGYYPAVSADGDGNFVVAWTTGDYSYAQRFQVAAPAAEEIPLLGKVAALSNKVPDDFEKSKGAWKASGSAIVSPLRGSASDPRCNGDPDGTVKATARFVSAVSGQDHTFDLPCENWSVTGGNKVNSVPKRGYKYKDPTRGDGPCNSVKITGTKSVSVSCKGKPGAASFPYDLVSSVSQGAVTAVLQMGLITHCAEFEPFIDGSDGKKYKGKSLTIPASCP